MNLYTSYFGKLRSFPSSLIPISIARFTPSWFTGNRLLSLAPSESLLSWYKRTNDWEGYKKFYYQNVLTQLNPCLLMDALERNVNGSDVVFLCYEKSSDCCHRSLVSDWLNSAGYNVQEWR